MYKVHEQKNWGRVGQSRWIIVDHNGNFVLGTYSKPVADICLIALNKSIQEKELEIKSAGFNSDASVMSGPRGMGVA